MQRFLMVLDPTPAPAPPPTKYLTTHHLKERGWTATLIAALLPAPDAARAAYVRLPGNALVKLYLRARVEEVEQSDDWWWSNEE